MHPRVPHPRELLPVAGRVNTFVTNVATSVLGSMAVFWAAFLIPLITVPASDAVKLIVSVVFSSWFQAWALPVLQRGQMEADAKRDAKADADHRALTSIHKRLDEIALAVSAVAPHDRT